MASRSSLRSTSAPSDGHARRYLGRAPTRYCGVPRVGQFGPRGLVERGQSGFRLIGGFPVFGHEVHYDRGRMHGDFVHQILERIRRTHDVRERIDDPGVAPSPSHAELVPNQGEEIIRSLPVGAPWKRITRKVARVTGRFGSRISVIS